MKNGIGYVGMYRNYESFGGSNCVEDDPYMSRKE